MNTLFLADSRLTFIFATALLFLDKVQSRWGGRDFLYLKATKEGIQGRSRAFL